MIARTIGWLIILALSVLCFGAIMSNRYRIYYALRGVRGSCCVVVVDHLLAWLCWLTIVPPTSITLQLWYAFLRLDCTRWIIRKVRRQGPSSNTSLNEIIFDQNDMNEGLLLNSNQ